MKGSTVKMGEKYRRVGNKERPNGKQKAMIVQIQACLIALIPQIQNFKYCFRANCNLLSFKFEQILSKVQFLACQIIGLFSCYQKVRRRKESEFKIKYYDVTSHILRLVSQHISPFVEFC